LPISTQQCGRRRDRSCGTPRAIQTVATADVIARRSILLAIALAGGLLAATGVGLYGCGALDDSESAPLPLATVDMDRMWGGWYLIATIPNGFEKGMVAPYDVYSQRPDGDIREDFYVRSGSFKSPLDHYVVHDWIRPGSNNAHWRVRIFWPIDLPFLVLYTDPDYRYVMFGERNRKLGWIFARTRTIPDADYRALLERFRGLGYDPGAFLKFVQLPDQIGQPGVWSDGIE
jgi:apolipoprotein D and lipocalin family protein